MHYDLVVIGDDPAGQHAALAASRSNRRVALVERRERGPGSAPPRAGVIEGSVLREAVERVAAGKRPSESRATIGPGGQPLLHIRQRATTGRPLDRPVVTLAEVQQRIAAFIERTRAATEARMEQRGVDVYRGKASFCQPHELVVQSVAGDIRLAAENFIIATGTHPARPRALAIDGQRVFFPDDLLELAELPRTLFVIGGGIVGSDYAMLFASLAARVTLIDGGETARIVATRGIAMRLGEDVIGIERLGDGRIELCLEGGSRLVGDAALYTPGRLGDTDDLNLPAVGLDVDERGRLWCDANLQTCARHIYGVGDVVGFPRLADAPELQAQRVLAHAFGVAAQSDIIPLPGPHRSAGSRAAGRELPGYRRPAARRS